MICHTLHPDIVKYIHILQEKGTSPPWNGKILTDPRTGAVNTEDETGESEVPETKDMPKNHNDGDMSEGNGSIRCTEPGDDGMLKSMISHPFCSLLLFSGCATWHVDLCCLVKD